MVGYYGASILDFIGLQYISAGLERLVLFTYPTLTLIIAVLFLGKKLQRKEVGALILTYAGIALVFQHDLQFAGDSAAVWIGGLFVFASSLTYALYLSGSGVMIRRLGSARFTALVLTISTLAAEGHFIAARPYSALIQPVSVYALCAAMALFSTVLPVFMLSAAIHRIGSSSTALVGTLGPVLTIMFSWWLLGEPLSMMQAVGTALVLAGVVVVARA
jgi:drug/metabolite transporter (DMT)-like permease